MPDDAPPIDELASMLAAHLADGRIGPAVAEILARADETIAYYRPVCWNRGECCRFGRAGHRLYVTTAELIYFGQTHAAWPADHQVDSCPHQRDGRCQARRARPLGCRVFFCQASARWWQPAVTEAFLRQLREVGERLAVPYAYVEWLTGLEALRQVVSSAKGSSMQPS